MVPHRGIQNMAANRTVNQKERNPPLGEKRETCPLFLLI